ncbi:GtrA family protein [Candidatus Kaiserbacteria bacterium]|nr:MAG: GtrA family protein [Candidatus Kaiserbacteria bacterium]
MKKLLKSYRNLQLKYALLIRQIMKFSLTGLIAIFVLLTSLFFFTEIIGIWYLFSVVLANICTLIVNFLVQKYFVFSNYDTNVARKQFIWFIVLSVGYLIVNTLLMYLWVTVIKWPYLYAQTLNVILLAMITFYINRKYIFV